MLCNGNEDFSVAVAVVATTLVHSLPTNADMGEEQDIESSGSK